MCVAWVGVSWLLGRHPHPVLPFPWSLPHNFTPRNHNSSRRSRKQGPATESTTCQRVEGFVANRTKKGGMFGPSRLRKSVIALALRRNRCAAEEAAHNTNTRAAGAGAAGAGAAGAVGVAPSPAPAPPPSGLSAVHATSTATSSAGAGAGAGAAVASAAPENTPAGAAGTVSKKRKARAPPVPPPHPLFVDTQATRAAKRTKVSVVLEKHRLVSPLFLAVFLPSLSRCFPPLSVSVVPPLFLSRFPRVWAGCCLHACVWR